MLMHSNIPATQWNQIKAEIQKTWDKINAAELEGTHGDVRAISSLVQKRYGLKSDAVDPKIDECIERCGTAAGAASFQAASAGPADFGSSVDPSSLSASINQTSSGTGQNRRADVFPEEPHSRSFEAPEEGMDSEDMHASWNEGADEAPEGRDSRAAEDVTTSKPKRYASSQGVMNDSEFKEGRPQQSSETGNSGGSPAFKRAAGNSGRSETVKESARDPQRSSDSRSNARDRESDPASEPRSTEDSSKGELSS